MERKPSGRFQKLVPLVRKSESSEGARLEKPFVRHLDVVQTDSHCCIGLRETDESTANDASVSVVCIPLKPESPMTGSSHSTESSASRELNAQVHVMANISEGDCSALLTVFHFAKSEEVRHPKVSDSRVIQSVFCIALPSNGSGSVVNLDRDYVDSIQSSVSVTCECKAQQQQLSLASFAFPVSLIVAQDDRENDECVSLTQRNKYSTCLRLIDYLNDERKWRVFDNSGSLRASVLSHLLFVLMLIAIPMRIVIEKTDAIAISMHLSTAPGGNGAVTVKNESAASSKPAKMIHRDGVNKLRNNDSIAPSDPRRTGAQEQPESVKALNFEPHGDPSAKCATGRSESAKSPELGPGLEGSGTAKPIPLASRELLNKSADQNKVADDNYSSFIPAAFHIDDVRASRDTLTSSSSITNPSNARSNEQNSSTTNDAVSPLDRSDLSQVAEVGAPRLQQSVPHSVLPHFAPMSSGKTLRGSTTELSEPEKRLSDEDLMKKVKPVVPSVKLSAGAANGTDGDSGAGVTSGATFSAIYRPTRHPSTELFSRFGFYSTLYGPITPEGPVLDKTFPLPIYALCMVSVDSSRTFFLGEDGIVQSSQPTGLTNYIELPRPQRKMGWASGIAYDRKRDRIVVSSFGGNGFIYSYGPLSSEFPQWELVRNTTNEMLSGLVYSEESDCFFTLEGMATGKIRSILKLGPNGQVLQKVPVLMDVPVQEPVPQMFLAGHSLIVFGNARYGEKMIAVIDVLTGKVRWQKRMEL